MNAATLLATAFIITKTSGDSDESTYTSIHEPGNVNFNEIFSNSLAMLADDALTMTKDEDFHINPLPSQFAEFRLQSYTTTVPTTRPPTGPPTTELTTTPKPRFPKAKDLIETTTTELGEGPTTPTSTTTTTKTTTTTTTRSTSTTDDSILVVPMKNYQRGVLDLILPAARVKTFRDIFETFRRLLSYTF